MDRIKKSLVNEKGFTLIELIVVMIIIGILVLLATPRFLNYVRQAEYTRIINDIKVLEDVSIAYLARNEKLPVDYSKAPVNHIEIMKDKESYIKEGQVKMGTYSEEVDLGNNYSNYQQMIEKTRKKRIDPPVGNQVTGTELAFNFKYYKVPEDFITKEISSRLKGDFLINEEGLAIYVTDKVEQVDLEEEHIEGLTEANLRIKAKFMNLITVNGGQKYWTREGFEGAILGASSDFEEHIFFNNIKVDTKGNISITGKVMSPELWEQLKSFPGANENIPYKVTIAKHENGTNTDVCKIAIEKDGSAKIIKDI